eukprot:4783096-Prymnesium_polylepis.1
MSPSYKTSRRLSRRNRNTGCWIRPTCISNNKGSICERHTGLPSAWYSARPKNRSRAALFATNKATREEQRRKCRNRCCAVEREGEGDRQLACSSWRRSASSEDIDRETSALQVWQR